jgi:hypothetical protein
MLARMANPRRSALRAVAIPAIALCVIAVGAARLRAAADPLAVEIDRWSAFVKVHPATDEIWKQIKDGSEAVLSRASEALRAGRRLLALQRLAYAREQLLAATYMGGRSAEERKDTARFEAEWTRLGTLLQADLPTPRADAVATLQPAAVRALAEAALPQVGIYYHASLEYGRNTMPDSGLFYLGAAQAQRDFVAFARTLSEPSSGKPPAMRALGPDLDALEGDMLASYRPPLSIDKHPQFIAASSQLKEARELDAAGLRYGALLRYLQAAYRFAPLRASPTTLDAAALAGEIDRLGARLAAGGVDHSLGRLFLETAQSEAAAETGAANAAAIVRDVLPRYFAALDPPGPQAPRPPAQVTVTLVRWPYT